ncbi:MAG: HDOD domain-containing protein [Rhodocyclaceae bacterium]|nr:HDOD domain-containing protein [Rhodocyclaceae bacterium]
MPLDHRLGRGRGRDLSAKDCEAWFRFVSELAADLSGDRVVFPTAFETTLRLRDLLRSETASADDIARAVSADPLLSARLVQIANSAAFAADGRPVCTIRTAVLRLGLSQVRHVAVALAMSQLVTYRKMVPYRELCQRMLAHSRWVASISVVLAREHAGTDAGVAYLAGLVHDIGVFYLLYRLAERQDFFDNQDELLALIRDWHGQIGHAVLGALDVPEEIQLAIADHDEARRVVSLARLADLLFVANVLAEEASEASSPFADDGAPGRLGAGIERIGDYRATVAAHRDELLDLTRTFA